ncbi:MAG: glycosyltransferase [Clostridium sp.]|nr:glycosyltransferase [Clostridium sp.]
MATISLCMIVKNEEEVLGRCLASVRDLVDEIIIVDTGSEDRTKEIASEFTDRIYSFQWEDDFSAARNYAFSKASKDFCMWLDADDVMEEKDRERFLALRRELTPETDIVMMRYNTAFDDDGKPSFWYYRERLIRNDQTHFWQGAVHEVITPRGRILYWDAAVSHRKLHGRDPDRNLNIYRKMLSQGAALSARENYYYARELYYHEMYEEALEIFGRFLELPEGWIENKIEACTMMAKCCYKIGKRSSALQALLKSLEYDVPRAEVCCDVGNHFIESGRYEIAVFWFETALKCKRDFKRGGFILPDCYDYIPAIQLCVCCDKLGRYEEAKRYNHKAGMIKPGSAAYLYNKAYFEKKESGA